MISTEGKLHIKRFLAGYVPSIAQSIAFGMGSKTLAASDSRLHFETGRINISLTSLDVVNNKLTFKGQLPEDFSGRIYELGLYSSEADAVAGEFGSRLLATFDEDTEDWVDGTNGNPSVYTSTTSRIGNDSLRQAPAASATKTDVLNQLALDLSGYSGGDLFLFAYNVGNGFTSNLRFRFMTDTTNYYDFNLGAQTAGYKVTEVAKSTAVVTGAPQWERITAIQVSTISAAGGASAIDLDGIRIEDVDTVNPEYVLVARDLLPTHYVKEEGQIQEIEFAMEINV